jgi:hypothetical protein
MDGLGLTLKIRKLRKGLARSYNLSHRQRFVPLCFLSIALCAADVLHANALDSKETGFSGADGNIVNYLRP